MPTQLFNKSEEKDKRRFLRKNFSKAELLVWSKLRDRQLNKDKFRRQYGIGPYVVDFYCPTAKVIVEIDGDSHFQGNAPEYDAIRQRFLEGLGMKVIRFTNLDVLRNLDEVFLAIRDYLTPPSPSKGEGEKRRGGETGSTQET